MMNHVKIASHTLDNGHDEFTYKNKLKKWLFQAS